jgi:glutamate formiminotransferase
VATARAIAREVRTAASGLKSVKAIGMVAHGRAQLALNVSDFQATPISQVYKKVAQLAARHKVEIAGAQIMGLIPEAALERESDWVRLLEGFDPQTKILERRLEHPLAWPGVS